MVGLNEDIIKVIKWPWNSRSNSINKKIRWIPAYWTSNRPKVFESKGIQAIEWINTPVEYDVFKPDKDYAWLKS